VAANAPICPILIVRPKRLEIAANCTKQITELISNRIKTDPLAGPFMRVASGTAYARTGGCVNGNQPLVSVCYPRKRPVEFKKAGY
jgi:hypothetical protein